MDYKLLLNLLFIKRNSETIVFQRFSIKRIENHVMRTPKPHNVDRKQSKNFKSK